MSGPTWLANFFAAVMLLVALYSAGRLLASWRWSRPTHADIDVTHILMGVSMAGMLVSAINPIPSAVCEVVFVAVALWFVWKCLEFVARRGVKGRDEDHVHHLSHYVTHVVMAFAMLYMYLAASRSTGSSPGGGMGMTPAAGSPASSGADDREEPGAKTQSRQWLAPGLKAACHIAMCVTMGYMLIVML